MPRNPEHEAEKLKLRQANEPISVFSLIIRIQTAANGRPLAESHYPEHLKPALHRKGIRMDTRPAPYNDSRQGTVIDTDAQQEAKEHFPAMLAGFAFLHDQYHQLPTAAPKGSIAAIDALSAIGIALPSYCMARKVNPYPPTDALPPSWRSGASAFG